MALKHAQEAIEIATSANEKLEDIGTTLAAAFYNAGTEMEYLGCYKEALISCTNGLKTCKDILGPNHFLCNKLKLLIKHIEKNDDSKGVKDKEALELKDKVQITKLPNIRKSSNPAKIKRLGKRNASVLERQKNLSGVHELPSVESISNRRLLSKKPKEYYKEVECQPLIRNNNSQSILILEKQP